MKATLDCSITVSYTHLDVYKRQAHTVDHVHQKADLHGDLGVAHAAEPVSYTHLDVYKRQALGTAVGGAAEHEHALALLFGVGQVGADGVQTHIGCQRDEIRCV